MPHTKPVNHVIKTGKSPAAKPALSVTTRLILAAVVLLLAAGGVAFVLFKSSAGADEETGATLTPPSPASISPTSTPTGNTPVSCPVTSQLFCSLLRLAPGTECTFESSYVNDQCEMPCDAVIEVFTQVGLYNYPAATPGTQLNMGLSTPPPGTSPNTTECRLAVAMQQYGLKAQHNAGDSGNEGLRNFYMSIGNCINKKYNC